MGRPGEFGELSSESAARAEASERVLIVAPTGRDATVARAVLREAGVEAEVDAGGDELGSRLATGVSALLIAQEALDAETVRSLVGTLRSQPEWSDLKVIVLAHRGSADSSRGATVRDLVPTGNVVIMERPFRASTLISAVRVALRARARQHQLRELLLERERAHAVLLETVAAVRSELEQSHNALR